MTGHAHRVFPGKDYEGLDGVPRAGRLNGVPAIMPGFWGSHLGVVDLTLKREGRALESRTQTSKRVRSTGVRQAPSKIQRFLVYCNVELCD